MTRRAAGGLVTDADGRVAIVHRPHRSDWTLPKGHLEVGESDEDAALREVREEAGFVCRITGDAGETAYRDHKGREKVVRYFTMEIVEGDFTSNDEVDAIDWIDADDADRLTYADDVALVRRWAADRAGGVQRDE